MYNNGNSSKNVTGSSVVDGTMESADFPDNGLSGDKIDGGIISNFQTTGIDDRLSTVKNVTITDSGTTVTGKVDTSNTAKVWVNFNNNTTIRDSHNVSSVTDNGTGDATINFTNNLANANYSAIASAMNGSINNNYSALFLPVAYSTSSFRCLNVNYVDSPRDGEYINLQIFGD
jgi:hypothetical protein